MKKKQLNVFLKEQKVLSLIFIVLLILVLSCQKNIKDVIDPGKFISHSFDKLELNQFKDPESFYWPAYFLA